MKDSDLERRVEQLESQVERLRGLVHPDMPSFERLLLELNATREQESQIYDLMESCEKDLRDGKALDAFGFESSAGRILRDPNPHQVASRIVTAFADDGRYDDVVGALKGTGWLG